MLEREGRDQDQVGLSDLIEKGYRACIKGEAELQVGLRWGPVNLLLKGWLFCLLPVGVGLPS